MLCALIQFSQNLMKLTLLFIFQSRNWNFREVKWPAQVPILVKNLSDNAGDIRDMGLIPGSGRSLGEGIGNPLRYSCLENPRGRRAWLATVHRVAKSWTYSSNHSGKRQSSK